MSKETRNINLCAEWLKNHEVITLDLLLDEISVMEVTELDNHDGNPMLDGWYAVADTNGIIAYFGEKEEALGYRLGYINRILNTIL